MSLIQRTLLLMGVLWLLASSVQAQTILPTDTVDHELVSRFPGAQIVQYRSPGITNYRLALDRMQRVNGRVMAGREERLRGELTRITYRIPEGYSGQDVFTHYSAQMLAVGEELFRCAGRGCGSSNFWANDVFEYRILYGPEAEQFYLATSVGGAGQPVRAYLSLYVITRGNRSVYAHLDVLELSDAVSSSTELSPQSLVLQLEEEGSVILQGLEFDEQDALTEAGTASVLAEALRNAPALRVYVVGHLADSLPLETLKSRSEARAQAVVALLIAEGIAAERVLAQGIGPLAPQCRQSSCDARIEVVVIP